MRLSRLDSQRGFGYIAAIVLLVMLAGLAAGLVRLSTTQQTTSALDLNSARAYQAAGAGIQWALHQALTTAGGCPSGTLSLDTGFNVTVSCETIPFDEGESAPGTALEKRLFSVTAVACNLGNPCPGNGASPDYVERRRIVSACVSGTFPALSAC
jgi:MSHA biogenesis protein MshP